MELHPHLKDRADEQAGRHNGRSATSQFTLDGPAKP
jgi:hypothetical protein